MADGIFVNTITEIDSGSGGTPITTTYNIEAQRMSQGTVGSSKNPVYFLDGVPTACDGSTGGGGGSDVIITPDRNITQMSRSQKTTIATFKIDDGDTQELCIPRVSSGYQKQVLFSGVLGETIGEGGGALLDAPFTNFDFLYIYIEDNKNIVGTKVIVVPTNTLYEKVKAGGGLVSCELYGTLGMVLKFTSPTGVCIEYINNLPNYDSSGSTDEYISVFCSRIEGVTLGISQGSWGQNTKDLLWAGEASVVDPTIFIHFIEDKELGQYDMICVYGHIQNEDDEDINFGSVDSLKTKIDKNKAFLICGDSFKNITKTLLFKNTGFYITDETSEEELTYVITQIDGIKYGAEVITNNDISNCMVKGVDYVTAGKDSEVYAPSNYYATYEGYKTSIYNYNNLNINYSGHVEGHKTSIINNYNYDKHFGYGNHTEGYKTQVYANANDFSGNHAEGYKTCAYGYHGTHAEGSDTTAVNGGIYGSSFPSHAEGQSTYACYGSHSEGGYTKSYGIGSHAEGYFTCAIWNQGALDKEESAHAEGYYTTAIGRVHSEGTFTYALGHGTHVEGVNSSVIGVGSHAEGYYTTNLHDVYNSYGQFADIWGNHSEGYKTSIYNAIGGHVEGYECTVRGKISLDPTHADSSYYYTYAAGHAEGLKTYAGYRSHAEGVETYAHGMQGAHAEGYKTSAEGHCAHAEGWGTTAMGVGHAEGSGTIADGGHAEGASTYTTGGHAEGFGTYAYNDGSHSEGLYTTAGSLDYYDPETEHYIDSQHAEGRGTYAYRRASHAEGYWTSAYGEASHAEGGYTYTGNYAGSHAEGVYTTAGNYAAHAGGHFNYRMADGGNIFNQSGDAFVIGNGIMKPTVPLTHECSNAFAVSYRGYITTLGSTEGTSQDYAEYFEWADGNIENEDRTGYFVTFDNHNKIRIANANDDYILGIVSGEPFVVGNGDNNAWKDKFLKDSFGRKIVEPAPLYKFDKEENEYKPVLDENGEQVYEGTRFKINPDYDPDREYTRRKDRTEWSPVGMLGVLSVYDDGSCIENGYCTVTDNGIATYKEKYTKNENCYRVLERLDNNIIKIVFR